ncbi:hypothetical protein [uncultured Serinicoccus sp.]|uniref:hypothetical protein n=1 Tax=uncultured Serinicoccus sp. TaxID=735514 RepID=UPI002624FCA6|nr:hypothetical protein [uncultured Serinicoccus sp.]
MTIQSTSTSRSVTGTYRVIEQRQGSGIDFYFSVSGPDGRTSEQKVLWYPSMTALQVAEAAVAARLEADGTTHVAAVAAQQDPNEGGFVVRLT